MAAFCSSREVYEYFVDRLGVDDDGDVDAIALFAYSLVEHEKYQWSAHVWSVDQQEPSEEAVQRRFREKPPVYYEKKIEEAREWYLAFARTVLQDEIERRIKKDVARFVTEEFRTRLSYWTNFWLNFWSGLASTLAFGMMIFIVAIFVYTDFSVAGLVKKILSLSAP